MQGAQQETTELGEPSCVGYSEGTFAALFEPVVSSSPQILAGLPSVVSTDGDVFYVSVGQVNVDHEDAGQQSARRIADAKARRNFVAMVESKVVSTTILTEGYSTDHGQSSESTSFDAWTRIQAEGAVREAQTVGT